MEIGTLTRDKATRVRFRSAVLPWLVLLIGLPASIVLFLFIQNSVENVARLRFEREANNANSVIENRLRSYTDVLHALRALFASEEPVDRLRFRRFVESLDVKRRYPGFFSLNYAAYVPARDKRQFEESVRRDTSLNPGGYPNFTIKPPGERSEYYVIVYLEPLAGYEFALGLDLGANPMADDPEKVAAAVRLHRDSGTLTASAQPLRVKREREAIYLAMRLGVYRQGMPVDTVEQRRTAYLGSVGAGFDVENLMKSALNDEMLRYLRLRLYDAGSAFDQRESRTSNERRLLFDSNQVAKQLFARSGTDDSNPAFVRVVPLELAGRIWEFEYSAAKDSVVSDTDRLLPPLVLAGGLLSSVLLFGVVYSLATSRSRAVEIANEITRDLRESEASLAEAQRMAHLGNWALDPANWSMTWSAETCRMFGLDPQSAPVAYADFLRRVHEDERAALDAMIRRTAETGEDGEMEHRICLNDGSMRWVHTIAKPGYGGADANFREDRPEEVVGACLDITERRHAAEALQTSAEQLQALSRRLVDIQELERRRFSRELHDVVGQNLTALSINLDILKTQLPGEGNQGLRSRLDDSAALLDSTTGAIENVMSELRPPMLDDYGLLPALQWYGTEFSKRTGIRVEVNGDERMKRVPPAAEIALFRVAQEALNNVAKHAHATSVGISLERRGTECSMSVSDDGRGLDAASVSNPKRRSGLGMVTMRERMQAVGGQFEIGPAPGRGTKVLLRVPC